jgi:hypothetical protein
VSTAVPVIQEAPSRSYLVRVERGNPDGVRTRVRVR